MWRPTDGGTGANSVMMVLVCGLLACEQPDEATEPVVREISDPVHRLLPTSGEVWELLANPALSLGNGLAGGPTFHHVDQVLTLPDGSLVVADRGNARIHRFNQEGRLLGSMGAMGFGPGEFRTIAGILAMGGDTILALDPAGMRFTYLSANGDVLSTHRLAAPDGIDAGLSTYRLVGRWGVRAVVLAPRGAVIRSRPVAEAFTISNPLLAYDLEGRLIGELPRAWRLEMWGDERTSLVRPFGAHTLTRARTTSFYFADPYEGWIERWEGEPAPEEVLDLRHEPLPVGGRVREAWIEDWLQRIDDPADRREQRRRLESVPFPDHLPAFDDLAVGPTGRLWLRELVLPGSPGPSRWTVLEADGTPVARLDIPLPFQLHEIQGDRVLGVWTDSLGTETVRSYPIRRN